MLYYASKWVYGLLLLYLVISFTLFCCHKETQREKDIRHIKNVYLSLGNRDFDGAKEEARKISNTKAREGILLKISMEKTFDNWKRLGIFQGD